MRTYRIWVQRGDGELLEPLEHEQGEALSPRDLRAALARRGTPLGPGDTATAAELVWVGHRGAVGPDEVPGDEQELEWSHDLEPAW
jgi:hypothetical protein